METREEKLARDTYEKNKTALEEVKSIKELEKVLNVEQERIHAGKTEMYEPEIRLTEMERKEAELIEEGKKRKEKDKQIAELLTAKGGLREKAGKMLASVVINEKMREEFGDLYSKK